MYNIYFNICKNFHLNQFISEGGGEAKIMALCNDVRTRFFCDM